MILMSAACVQVVMATTRFFLDTRKSKEGRPAVLKIAIAHKHKAAMISLDVKVLPTQWENNAVTNHPHKSVLNLHINRVKNQIDGLILGWTNEGVINEMTANEIKEKCEIELNPNKKKAKLDETTFIFRFDKYASRMKPGSKRVFDHTRNRLVAYLGEEKLAKLKFEEMTVDWLKDFDTFMAKTSPSKNSRNIHFRNIRTVFNYSIEDGITDFYPFRRFKLKREVTAKRDLTVEELRRLIFFDCEECAVKYRDYFLLMFYLFGVNNVDICHLKASNINRGRLEFNRTKTNHFFSMKIEPEAKKLLDKYKGKNYLIDILDHWNSDEYFRKKMNKHLKRIGPVTRSGLGGKKEYEPLFPKLTTYYARHSWASIAFSLDIPMETISEGLGHEYGNPITIIYIHKDNRKVDAANRKVIDWVLDGKIDGKVKVKPGTPEFFGLKKKEAIALGLVKESEGTPKETKKRGRTKKES